MAAKRFFDGGEDQPNQKRMKTRPSFASVIREVVMVNFLENFCSALEPMLRRVVCEEVESGLRRRGGSSTLLQYSPMRMIQQAASLQLTFAKRLSVPIFTGTKIVDADGNPLQIILVEAGSNHTKVTTSLPYSIKLEIVVLDGDFPNKETWTDNEFMKGIVKERTGKRPLLTGDLNLTMRDGQACVGDIEFTDNSSWIRSRKFRIGARVVQVQSETGQAVLIREAKTEAFVVKDHRGELYKKHHPPSLDDEVWRLEKIGKGGALHRKLASQGIKTVQDFLKLFYIDSTKLKKILGVGMSEKMWEATVKHAKECVLGTKLYKSHGNNFTLILNPVCQLVKLEFNGHVYHESDLKWTQAAYVEALVKDAYAKWNSLEEVDGELQIHETALLTQGEVGQYSNHQQQLVGRSYQTDGGCPIIQTSNVVVGNCTDEWALNSTGFYLSNASAAKSGIRFFSESSSEGDIP